MKNLLRGLFLASVIGVLIVSVALSAPHETTLTIAASKVLATQSPLGDSCVKSTPFFIDRNSRSAFLVVAFSDTNLGPVGGSDSIQVALQKGIVLTTSDILAPDSVWETVVEMNPLAVNKTLTSLSMQRYLSPDSTDVGAWQLGGMHRWIAYAGQSSAGAVEHADTMVVEYVIKCYIETEGYE
jgi:hypothetical protein